MKKYIYIVFLVVIGLSMSGCASYLSYKASEKEIVKEKVMASGDDVAIKALRMGDGVGIGVNVLATESIQKHPVRQLGAALLDAGMIYGAYAGLQTINDNSSNSKQNSIDISGDGNNIIITPSSQSTSTTIEHDNSQVTQ